MTHYNLALLGFGNVGRALARLLARKEADIRSQYGITFRITGIYTGRHGGALDSRGMDAERAVVLVESGGRLDELSQAPVPPNAFEFIRSCGADVLFENTPVNYETGQPAVDHLRLALEQGMHALTANKGPVVHAYRELSDLAQARGRKFFFESTVMDGCPIFSLFRGALPAARLLSFRGILNSTTNLILTRMEAGESFEDAVAYAQKIGLAETDPSGDVDGWDAAVKVAALVTVLMGVPLKPSQVDRQGIRGLSAEEVRQAREAGKRWKLVCTARLLDQGAQAAVEARVAPELVDRDSPMFAVENSTSIAEFETDVLGKLSIIEEDPGPDTTAYGLLADFLNAARSS